MGLQNLKRIAYFNITNTRISGSEIDSYLSRWWAKKYNRPTNDPLLLSRTTEDLLVEFYQDVFELDKDEYQNFEIEEGISNAISDEDWFKKHMKDEYTPNPAYSKKHSKQVEEFDDNYSTLGS